MNFISLFLAIIAGGLGAALRYASTVILPAKKDGFPLAVFVVNAVGSLLVGLVTALLANSVLSPEVSFVFVAGFCGGLTTFSGVTFEVMRESGAGFTYLVANVLGSLIAVAVALPLSRKWIKVKQ